MACNAEKYCTTNTSSCSTVESLVDINEKVSELKFQLGVKFKKLQLPPDSNYILEKCLRRRNFNLDKAADQVHSYFKILSDMYKMHNDMYFLPSLHREYFYDSFGMVLLKHRDAMGRAVIWTDFEKLHAETFCLDKTMASALLILNELTSLSLNVQRNGVVYVYNMKGFRFCHAKQFTLPRIRALSKFLRGAIPVSFKAFHMINSPPAFVCVYSWLLKPFIGKKISDRVHFYGSDLTELYKELSRETLPNVLGGELSIEECVDKEFINALCTKDNYYMDLLQHGYCDYKKGES